MSLELKHTRKQKVESIELDKNKIKVKTVTGGSCLINIEMETFMTIKMAEINTSLPIPAIHTFVKKLINDCMGGSTFEYIIDNQIEGDYYGYLIIDGIDNIPLRISDAMIILDESIPKYINADLIQNGTTNLQLELQEAIKTENYKLAAELKEKIKLDKEKRN